MGRGVAQADIPVTDEFVCRIVYIGLARDMTKGIETKLDTRAENAVVSK